MLATMLGALRGRPEAHHGARHTPPARCERYVTRGVPAGVLPFKQQGSVSILARSRLVATEVAVLAGILVLGACGGPASSSLHRGGIRANTLSSMKAEVVPAGGMRVNYGDASIVVPFSWRTLLPGVTTCAENVVLLGNAVNSCPAEHAPGSRFLRSPPGPPCSAPGRHPPNHQRPRRNPPRTL